MRLLIKTALIAPGLILFGWWAKVILVGVLPWMYLALVPWILAAIFGVVFLILCAIDALQRPPSKADCSAAKVT